MDEKRRSELASVSRLAGVLLLVVAPGLSYLRWNDASGAVATLRAIQARTPAPVTQADTLTLSSAMYHAGHGQQTIDSRWGPTGFLTLGALGFAGGAVLLAWPWMRRRPETTS